VTRNAPAASGAASRWEWVAAALGALLVAAALAVLLRSASVQGGDPVPRLAVLIDSVIPYDAGFIVRFRVRNEGGQTAARVLVRGVVGAEESEMSLDFVPGRSERRGGLLFTRDPRQQPLVIRAVGYDEP
jgi:uncharacterized protein (TIGR02588 family)